jgi:hypothetical protein
LNAVHVSVLAARKAKWHPLGTWFLACSLCQPCCCRSSPSKADPALQLLRLAAISGAAPYRSETLNPVIYRASLCSFCTTFTCCHLVGKMVLKATTCPLTQYSSLCAATNHAIPVEFTFCHQPWNSLGVHQHAQTCPALPTLPTPAAPAA